MVTEGLHCTKVDLAQPEVNNEASYIKIENGSTVYHVLCIIYVRKNIRPVKVLAQQFRKFYI